MEQTTTAIAFRDDENVDQVFETFLKAPSDIQDHMPLLRQLASEVKHVTEFGCRGCFSTVALLAGKPRTLVTWDIDPMAVSNALTLSFWKGHATDLHARRGDTTKILIEETDLLFIDTVHSFEHLRSELKRHGNKARKYLVFHDTVAFGYVGDDGKKPGLRAAIRWFQDQTSPRWQLVEDDKRGSGMIVLQRHDRGFGPYQFAKAFDVTDTAEIKE